MIENDPLNSCTRGRLNCWNFPDEATPDEIINQLLDRLDKIEVNERDRKLFEKRPLNTT